MTPAAWVVIAHAIGLGLLLGYGAWQWRRLASPRSGR